MYELMEDDLESVVIKNYSDYGVYVKNLVEQVNNEIEINNNIAKSIIASHKNLFTNDGNKEALIYMIGLRYSGVIEFEGEGINIGQLFEKTAFCKLLTKTNKDEIFKIIGRCNNYDNLEFNNEYDKFIKAFCLYKCMKKELIKIGKEEFIYLKELDDTFGKIIELNKLNKLCFEDIMCDLVNLLKVESENGSISGIKLDIVNEKINTDVNLYDHILINKDYLEYMTTCDSVYYDPSTTYNDVFGDDEE